MENKLKNILFSACLQDVCRLFPARARTLRSGAGPACGVAVALLRRNLAALLALLCWF